MRNLDYLDQYVNHYQPHVQPCAPSRQYAIHAMLLMLWVYDVIALQGYRARLAEIVDRSRPC